MNSATPERPASPAQIRAAAAAAFRRRQLLDLTRSAAPAATAPPLRAPLPGETALSGSEVAHGAYHGVFTVPDRGEGPHL